MAKKPDVPPIAKPVLAKEPTKEPTRELTEGPGAATTPSSPQSPASTASSTHESGGCPYILTKGERQGQPCGKKPRKGASYCCRHKKYEGVEQKEKKALPVVKKAGTSSRGNTTQSKGVSNVFREHKATGHYYNPETGLALKSLEDKVVCGKLVDGKILTLGPDDIEACKARGFRYLEKPVTNTQKVSQTNGAESSVEEPRPKRATLGRKTPDPEKASARLRPSDGRVTKKSIADAIATASEDSEDVEAILGALSLGANSDGEEEEILSDENDCEELDSEE